MESPDLDAIRARTDAASPEPWIAEAGDEAWSVRTSEGSLSWDDHGGEVFTPENAAFLAHAREDVPALIEALEKAQARLAEAAAQALEDMAYEIAVQRDSATLDVYGDSQWAVRDHSDGRYLGKTVAIRLIRERAKQLRAKDTE